MRSEKKEKTEASSQEKKMSEPLIAMMLLFFYDRIQESFATLFRSMSYPLSIMVIIKSQVSAVQTTMMNFSFLPSPACGRGVGGE